MSEVYAIDVPPTPSLSIAGSSKRFPVRRVYCVGRNYAAHAIEMGHDPDREDPFFFQKNPDNLVADATSFPYPPRSQDVHHEVELVVALHSGGSNIAVENALSHVWGYGVGLDMTRRDLQGQMKKAGRPWEIGKAFEDSAPCTALIPASEIGHPDTGRVWLDVNGENRQEGDLNQLIWKIPEMINYLSELFELAPGDVIFSGTPSGVGAINPGDVMTAGVEGVGEMTINVV